MKKRSQSGALPRTLTRRYNERRQTNRLKIHLRVDYCPLVRRKDEGVAVGQMRRGVATDISTTGIFLGNTGYLRVGSLLHLFIRLPDVPANPVACYARVVRGDAATRLGYGLRFLRVAEDDARRLTRYIRYQLARAALNLTG